MLKVIPQKFRDHLVFRNPLAEFNRRREGADHRILAIGHWGTYKRLETLMDAFPAVVRKVPTARLIIAGANHHTKPGYWESIRESQRANPRIEFRGYVTEEAVPELFRTASIVVLPYSSATGSSGPAHQACEYGVPIVSADLAEFRTMAEDENMAITFYKTGDPADLAAKLIALLESQEEQHQAAEQNYSAALRMTMPNVVRNYLRWFELAKRKQALGASAGARLLGRWRLPAPWLAWAGGLQPPWLWEKYGLPDDNPNGRLLDPGSSFRPQYERSAALECELKPPAAGHPAEFLRAPQDSG